MFPTASVCGQASEEEYCQTVSFGNFLVLLLLEGKNSDEEMDFGSSLLAKIEEEATQSPELSPAAFLEMQKEQLPKISIVIGKISGQKLSISASGKVGAKLIRKGKIINLLAGASDQGQGARSISGPLLHGDLLFLGTAEFFGMEGQEEIMQSATRPLEEIKENLITKLEARQDKGKIGAIFTRVVLTEQKAVVDQEIESAPPMTQSPSTVLPLPHFSLQKLMESGKTLIPNQANMEDSSSRRTIYLIAIVFVILASVIAFQLRSKNLETNAKNLGMIATSASNGINSASKLFGLNDQIARNQLVQTRTDVENQIENTYGTDWQNKDLPDKAKLKAILANIDEAIGKVSHVYTVSNPEVFYDFSLMKSNPKIVSSALHDGVILALDQSNGAVYSLKSGSKEANLLTGGSNLKRAQFVDFTPDTVYLFSPDGILSKSVDGSDSIKQVVKASDKIGRAAGLAAFGGNLYVLDSQNNQIWKYQGSDSGFSDVVNYLNAGITPDFSSAKMMQIDGYVYVLAGGQVARFSAGDVSDFTLSGLPEQTSGWSAFYTSDETQNVYLWDSEEKKVVVVDKKGAYQAEYKLGASSQSLQDKGLGASAQILADEKARKIFLLSESMVYAIDIK